MEKGTLTHFHSVCVSVYEARAGRAYDDPAATERMRADVAGF